MSIRSKVAFGGVVCVIAAALSAPCMAATPGDYDGDGKAPTLPFSGPRTGSGTSFPASPRTLQSLRSGGQSGTFPCPAIMMATEKLTLPSSDPRTGRGTSFPAAIQGFRSCNSGVHRVSAHRETRVNMAERIGISDTIFLRKSRTHVGENTERSGPNRIKGSRISGTRRRRCT